MRIADFANFVGLKFIKFNNPKVVCPPGTMQAGEKKLIIVPTIMRSGTHLLIDSLLNNFPDYKRAPLYVDLDKLLKHSPGEKREEVISRLIACSGYVVKTHYPQEPSYPEWEAIVSRLASEAAIVRIVRDPESTFQSLKTWRAAFGVDVNREEYFASVERFNRFWDRFECFQVTHNEIISREEYPGLIAELGNYINARPKKKVSFPPRKKARLNVYATKILTRLLGNKSPVINTTINFDRTQHRK